MLKKRLILPLIALLVIASLLPVSAVQLPPDLLAMLGRSEAEPAEFVLVGDHLVVYEGILGKQMSYVAEVENKSQGVGTLQEATLQVFDAAGAELGSVPVYSSNPVYVKPGEKTFLSVSYSMLTAEQLAQVATWKLTMNAVLTDFPDNNVPLEVTSEITEGTGMDYLTGADKKQLDLVHTVTNTTGEPAYDARTYAVLRDASGKAVAFDEQMAMNVGIPAGGSIMLKGKVDAGLLEVLEAAGTAPVSVDTIAFYSAQ